MSLDNYLAKARGFGAEIRFEFSSKEVEQLYNFLKELGYREYLTWVYQHQEEVLKYISLSQSQRQQKKWVNHSDNLLIRLAAYQTSLATDQLLADISPIADYVDNGSYRKFHSLVADALLPQIFYSPFRHFPFEGCPDPFLN